MRLRLPVVGVVALVASASAGPHGPREPSGLVVDGRPARSMRLVDHSAHRDFATLAAAGWQATWDRDTGVPLAISGSHIDVPGSTHDARVALAAARAFVAAHLGVLAPGAAIGDFAVVSNQLDRGVRTIGFAQSWHGMAVVGGQLGVVFAHDRLFAVMSNALPAVHAGVQGGRALTQRARAEAWVRAATGHAATARGLGDRVVLPIVHGPGDIEYRIADVVDVSLDPGDAPGRWDVYVAPDGTPIARRSTLHAGTGTVEYDVGVRYASGPRHNVPAVTAFVTANGTAATTDGSGNVTWTGASPASVIATATGSAVTVVNEAGAPATATLSIPDGGADIWNVANIEFDDAQVSTYVYANIALAADRIINPSIDAFLAGPIEFDVNNAGTCNGFSNGDLVYLYQADAECENTGRLADVVEHEFGHVFHKHSIIAGMGSFTMDQGMLEGLADYNAANINDDSGVGRGFDYTDRPVRDIDPVGIERVYPDDLSSDPHVSGEILSGALWDLRKAFIAQLGHDAGITQAAKIFLGVMQRSPDMPSAYMAALIADDDDGDLGNGTPDQCAIEDAFGIHGLVSDFTTTTVSTPIVDGVEISVPVDTPAPTDGCPVRQVTSVIVQWQVNDSFLTNLSLTAGDGAWTGAFPAQPDGTVIDYGILVAFDDGSSLELPNNAADPLYETFVGPSTPIMCETMDRDPMWTQTGDVGGEWNWAVPMAAGTQSGDPPDAHTGSGVLGTFVNSFDGGYYDASDQTSIQTPVVDTSDYEEVHLQFWRWLTVEDGTYDQASISANGTTIWHNAMSATGLLDHVDREWRFQDIDVTSLVDVGAMQIAWNLTSDGSYELGGWNLDDVCIVGLAKLPLCGDGKLDPDEQCDDGNTFSGDGCSDTCQLEIFASGGGCATAPGAGIAIAIVLVGLRRRRR